MEGYQIQDQIDRILRSESLADKKQLRTLLEFLSKNIDSQATLKPSQVIRELWADGGSTKGSADIATEMNRLRKAVETYYRVEGQSDPILIRFPSRAVSGSEGLKGRRWICAEGRSVAAESPVSPTAHLVLTPPNTQSRPDLSVRRQRQAFREKYRRTLFVLTTLVLLGVAAYFTARHFTPDSRPRMGHIDHSELVIMDADGKELWRKAFPGGFWSEYYTDGVAMHLYSQDGLESHLWFGDLDGDGHTEVLFLYHPATDPKSHSTTLICYSDQGKEKWRWTPGRALPEVESVPSVYITMGFGVLSAAKNQHRRIVVMSRHEYYYPTQIAVVDSTGKTLSEYWHSGHLFHFKLAKLAGRDEIVASGISNGYLQATLLVLDPDHVSGASAETARPEVQIHGMGAPSERLRLLFPRSDLNRDLYRYNQALGAVISPSRLQIDVKECWLTVANGCTIIYGFDEQFNLLSAGAEDTFLNAHKEFYSKSKDDHPFSSNEEAQFRKVRCLVGCKTEFVPVQIP